MPAKNEIMPLDTKSDGSARSSVGRSKQVGKNSAGSAKQLEGGGSASPLSASPLSKASTKHLLNTEATSAQERRIRLVSHQKRHTTFQLFYAMFGLVLMVVQMEYLWLSNTKGLELPCVPAKIANGTDIGCFHKLPHEVPVAEGRMILHSLRVLISLSTVLMLYYVYVYYAAECEVMKIKNIVPPKATLLSSSLRNHLVAECLVLAVHPFPGLDSVDSQWPHLVVFVSLLMFARVFLILRVVQFRHSFNTSNGWFISSLTNVDFTTTFFLKSTLKNYPSRCIIACFVLLLGVVGYSLFVVERFLCAFDRNARCEPMGLDDALWTLIITMLTIGYGDVVPRTVPGRVFAVLAGLFGTIFIAVTIAVMSNYLVLTRSEHKVNAFLKKDENRRLINDHAARAIQAFMQLRSAQYHANASTNGTTTTSASTTTSNTTGKSRIGRKAKGVERAEMKVFDVLKEYRRVKRYVNSHDVSDPLDKQMTMLEMMEVNVEYIRTRIEELTELFHHQIEKSRSFRRLSSLHGVAPITTSTSSTMTTSAESPQESTTIVATATSIHSGHTASESASTSLSRSEFPTTSSPDRKRSVTSTPDDISHKSQPGTANSEEQEMSTREIRRTSAPQVVREGYEGSSSASDEIPEWAVMLETTLQTILTQVERVSVEVEHIKSRVHAHMDDVNQRLSDMERRVGVQDALREIMHAHPPQARSTRHLLEQKPSESSLAISATTTELSDEHHPVLLRHHARHSFVKKKPSITNFLTAADLDEFK
ncbi:TPA: hypothetical protein N0F65_004296 [Lagenidium giganteum]|uniref:Potassium channel domain-containing protein n=1 Tax=Lagenidium giganteum TaxID=4803 RepID=A0AAV2ZH68_9STRA|nr:TPA: hypothetical protein N0F65_004296 [Lagenidium giganteum]